MLDLLDYLLWWAIELTVDFLRHITWEERTVTIRVKKSNRTSNFYELLIRENKFENNDKRCKFTLFCWNIKPTKIRYQYLRLHKKFDYFLSKFKVQIKVRWSHYIYFNDQTFSLQKRSFSYITFCKKHC